MEASRIAKICKISEGPPSTARVSLGRQFEDESLRHYEKLGFEFVSRNIYFAVGEIDLFFRAPNGNYLIVEVRSRRGLQFRPSRTLSYQKKRRLFVLARMMAKTYRRAVDIELCEWLCTKGKWNCRRFLIREA